MGWNPTVRQVLRTDLSARSSRKLYSCSTTLTFCRIIASLLQNCERRVTSNTVVLHHIVSIHPLFHGFITRWCPMHACLLFSTHLCLVPSILARIFPRYAIPLHRPPIPIFVFLLIVPNTTSFTSLLSSILQMCPNKFNFLSLILYKMFLLLPILFLISSFVIFFAVLHLEFLDRISSHM